MRTKFILYQNKMYGADITRKQQALIDLAEHIIDPALWIHTKKLLHTVLSLTAVYWGDLTILIPASLFYMTLMHRCLSMHQTTKKLLRHQQRLRNILTDIEWSDGVCVERIIKTIMDNLSLFAGKHVFHEANLLHDAIISAAQDTYVLISYKAAEKQGFGLLHFIRQERHTKNIRV